MRSFAAGALALLLLAGGGCGSAPGPSSKAPPRPHGAGARSSKHVPPSHARVPVLMYHVIESAPPGAQLPALYVSRADFAAQVNALAAKGYRAVTLQAVWDAWHGRGSLPRKPIVFSFDDGYRSQYTNALPVLRAKGWPGVLNLEVAVLHVDLRPPLVRRMIDAGWEVDSHTMTHPDLTSVDAARLRYEVATSRSWIKSHFHVPVNFFCYPSGRYDAAAVAAVRRAGFLAATTTDPGLTSPKSPRFELPRVRVNATDGVAGVERALSQAASASPGAGGAGE